MTSIAAVLTVDLAKRLAVEYAEKATDAVDDYHTARNRGWPEAGSHRDESIMFATNALMMLGLLNAALLPDGGEAR